MLADFAFCILFAGAKQHDVIGLVAQLSLVLSAIHDESKHVFCGDTNQRDAFSLDVGCPSVSQVRSKTIL